MGTAAAAVHPPGAVPRAKESGRHAFHRCQARSGTALSVPEWYASRCRRCYRWHIAFQYGSKAGAGQVGKPDPGPIQSNAHSGGVPLDNSALAGMLAESTLTPQGVLILALIQISVIGVLLWFHAAALSRKKPKKCWAHKKGV